MLLNYRQLNKQYNVNIKGVIHVGGHVGDELEEYKGVDNLIIFEPQPHCFEQLGAKARSLDMTPTLVNKGLGNFIGQAEIKSDKSGLIGSLLDPEIVLTLPDCNFTEKYLVDVSTLDDEVENPGKYNLLNMDVQGYELEVLKGGTETLKNIDYIYTEVNRVELYKDCAQIGDLDEYLVDFDRIATCWHGAHNWGDALYIRKGLI